MAIRDVPWNSFKGAILSVASSILPKLNEQHGVLAGQSDMVHVRDLINVQFKPGFPMDWFYTSQSSMIPFSSHIPSFSVPSLNFDAYYFLENVIYLLSNDLVEGRNAYNKCPDVLIILLNRIPKGVLTILFQSNLPTTRAMWEFSVYCAGNYGYRDAFIFLIDAGLRYSEWILPRGATYLSFAASMGLINIIRRLLKAGVRADDEIGPRQIPAIVEAAATGDLECLELLLERCDVNRIIYSAGYFDHEVSNFTKFLDLFVIGSFHTTVKQDHGYPPNSFKKTRNGNLLIISFNLENRPQSRALDMLLECGANVDLMWNGDQHYTDLFWFHKKICTPEDWRPTILEQSYYWDVKLFRRLSRHSTQTIGRPIRPDICLAAEQGKNAIGEYLKSHPAEPGFNQSAFLELVFAEQFFMKDTEINSKAIRGLIDFGLDPNLNSLPLDIQDLLYSLVFNASSRNPGKDFAIVVMQLLELGATINSMILEAAVGNEGIDMLLVLSKFGADVRNDGAEALCTAASLDNYEAVSWLLEAGVDINATVKKYVQPFDDQSQLKFQTLSVIALASYYPYLDWEVNNVHRNSLRSVHTPPASCAMLQHLIGNGAELKNNPDDPNCFNFLQSFLSTYDWHDMLEKFKLVLSLLPCRDLSGSGACLLEACLSSYMVTTDIEMEKRLVIFDALLENGAPINRESRVLSSLIYFGARHKLINMLLDAGVDINAYNPSNYYALTPVQAAASRGDKDLIIKLVSGGARINQPAVGDRGNTALQAACEWNPASAKERAKKLDLIQYLIGRGAEINAPPAPNYGHTALQWAAFRGDMDVALLLIHHGANPNQPSGFYGQRALDVAAALGRLDMVQFLLNVGALSYDRGRTGYRGAIKKAETCGYFAVADLIRKHVTNEMKVFGTNLAMSFQEDTSSELDEPEESGGSDDLNRKIDKLVG